MRFGALYKYHLQQLDFLTSPPRPSSITSNYSPCLIYILVSSLTAMVSVVTNDFPRSFIDLALNVSRLIVLSTVGATLVWAMRTLFVTATKIRSMPPGPPGLPLLGNVFELPMSRPWVKLTEWKQQHGAPMVSRCRPVTWLITSQVRCIR